MDTVTHSLLGTAVSDAWFRKRLGPIATPFALAVSALPDADVAVYFVSPESVWAHHRGYTHSLLPMLVAAPVLGWIGWRVSRRSGAWLDWSLLALICLYLHTLLDLATSWGTMPFLPFSNARLSWDLVPIIDIFVFGLTSVSFVVNRILRWEKVDHFLNPLAFPVVHRHPRRTRAADIVARVCCCLFVLYMLIGFQQNRQTVRIAREELAALGVRATEVRALPIMFTYISWGIAARDAEGAIYNAVYSSWAPRPMRFDVYRSARGPAVERARASRAGVLFAWYSQNMYTAEGERIPGGHRVLFKDRRFFSIMRPEIPRFAIEFIEDEGGQILSARPRRMDIDEMDVRKEMGGLWRLTRYGSPEARPDIVAGL